MAALETGRQRSNAFQILKELLQHRTLLRGWDKDTVRYSRLSPLPCTLSEKVTGGCLSSKQERNQEKGKDVKLETGSSRGEGSGVRPGRQQCARHRGQFGVREG